MKRRLSAIRWWCFERLVDWRLYDVREGDYYWNGWWTWPWNHSHTAYLRRRAGGGETQENYSQLRQDKQAGWERAGRPSR